MTLQEIEARQAQLQEQHAAAQGLVARLTEAEQIARENGWSFPGDIENQDAALQQIRDSSATDLARIVRLMPQTIGMKKDARARYLKASGVL